MRDDNSLAGGKPRFLLKQGYPDGMRVDTQRQRVDVRRRRHRRLRAGGRLPGPPETSPQDVSNLTFGGPKRNRLFVTCTFELYSVYVTANGVQMP